MALVPVCCLVSLRSGPDPLLDLSAACVCGCSATHPDSSWTPLHAAMHALYCIGMKFRGAELLGCHEPLFKGWSCSSTCTSSNGLFCCVNLPLPLPNCLGQVVHFSSSRWHSNGFRTCTGSDCRLWCVKPAVSHTLHGAGVDGSACARRSRVGPHHFSFWCVARCWEAGWQAVLCGGRHSHTCMTVETQ